MAFFHGFELFVIADEGMAWMFACHQYAARWGADCIARVMAGKAHALGGQAIEVGSADNFLAIAA